MNKNGCVISIRTDKSTVLANLVEFCGKNKKVLYAIINDTIDGQTAEGIPIPSEDFVSWYNERYKTPLDFNSDNAANIRKAMVNYFMENSPSLKDSVRETTTANVIRNNGYTSAAGREDGKKYITGLLLQAHIKSLFKYVSDSAEGVKDRYMRAKCIATALIDDTKLTTTEKNKIKREILAVRTEEDVRRILNETQIKSNFDVFGKNPDFYRQLAVGKIKSLVVDAVVLDTGEAIETVRQRIKEEGLDYIITSLGGKEMSLTTQNLVALYKELTTATEDYFDELLLNSKLEFIHNNKTSELDDENEKAAVNAVADEADETDMDMTAQDDDDVDLTILMYDHSGTYTSAMMHVNKDIKAYLDSLPLLNSTDTVNGEPDYDLNNELGLPMTMDANKCATILYHYASTASADAFIESIQAIAETLPGFAGFQVLVDFLKSDATAKYAFYSVFGKQIVSKVQVQEENGIRSLVIANNKSSKIDSFRQELFNTVRNTITKQDVEYNDELVTKAAKFVTDNAKYIDKNTHGKLAKSAIAKVVEVLTHYYPNLTDVEISSFVNKRKNKDGIVSVSENLQALIGVATRTVSASRLSQDHYTEMMLKRKEAQKEHKAEQAKYEQMRLAGIPAKEPEPLDLTKFYVKDYLDDTQKNVAIELSNLLVDYCVVKVENTSINPLGNQSSDVINSSFLTGMMQVLQNNVMLGKYGTFKFQSQQYNFSNILLESVDNDGTVNYGLFKRTADGGVEPTEYAADLLTISLYDGAKNYDEDKGITYAKHPKGDYIASEFTAFFSPTKENKGKRKFGAYMMRTPSDASKNFVITAPKYSSKGLLVLQNKQEVEARRREIRGKIFAKLLDDDVKTNNKSPIKIHRIDSIIKHLYTENFTYTLPEYIKGEYKEGQEVTLKLRYVSADGNNGQNIYVIRGVIENGTVVNANLVGIQDNDLSDDVRAALDARIDKDLDKEGLLQYSVNTNHVLVKQLVREFQQELLDMAIGLDKFFVLDERGLVTRVNEEIQWKDGISHDGREVDGAYDQYHHKKGVIVEKDDNGNEHLVGNAFTSNKFEVWDENSQASRNFGEEILASVFDPLYGGASGAFIHVTRNENGDIVGVELTESQNQVVAEKLAEYAIALINDAKTRLDRHSNIIGSKNLTMENIAEFVLNYQIMYNNFDDLFEGNSKFYKDSQTVLKRAKEVQGSGVPYGIANFLNTFSTERKVVASSLATTTFYGGHKVKQYDKFVGVTVVNTITSNEQTLDTLKKQLIKNGVDEAQAEKLIDGFRDTTVNDAQSYITFDEWIRRITARGQLNKYKPLIDKVLAGRELNGAELSEFIQVQKNFYYDQHYDTTSRIFAPRQIKNAEFVLVPQLIKGTELEAVAKLMETHGIDQLNTEETSKAGKTNTLSIFDAKTGKVHEDIIKEANGGAASKFSKALNEAGRGKQLYSYEFLYTQQETPQHLATENKAGVQIMKKIIDNINEKDGDLYQRKLEFIECYTANIKESTISLLDELNVPHDSDGNLMVDTNEEGLVTIKGLKYEVFYSKLKDELLRLGYDSNLLDYATLDAVQPDVNGNVTIMPNYMTMVGQKLENIAQSIFNNAITRQKLPGFHAAQITNIGFNPLKNSVDKVSYSHNLRYHTDAKGNYVDYVEIMLPASAFKFKRRTADGKLKPKGRIEANGQPTPGSLLEELYNANLQDTIGYRIPTEGKQSICKMRVVGFVDDAYGSTIVVPNEWVAQTGSDFDIDSVYGIQHSTYVDKEGHIQKHAYDDTKSALENTREARTNRILDCMMDMLSHPKSLEENLSRSNFSAISDAKKKIMGSGKMKGIADRRNSRSVYNVLDQADYMADAMSGAILKSFSVSRDNFCSICNTVRPVISNTHSLLVTYPTSLISEKEAIQRFGKENVSKMPDGKIQIRHNRFGWTLDNKNVSKAILTAYSSQTTALILDNIKEGGIPNVNDFTFGVFKLFPDLGIDYDTALAFMMQNGISRICDAYDSSRSVYISDRSKPIESAIRQIAKELGYEVNEWTPISSILADINKDFAPNIYKMLGMSELSLEDADNARFVFDSERLMSALSSPVEGIDAAILDLGIILQYNKLNNFATEISGLVNACRADKVGAKQTIFATNKIFDDILDIIEDDRPKALTVGDKSFLEAVYPGIGKGLTAFATSPFQQSAYPTLYTFLKLVTAPSILINRQLFPTQTPAFREFVDMLATYLPNRKALTEKQYKDFEKYIIAELYNNCKCLTLPINFNPKATKNVFYAPAVEGMTADQLEELKNIERARIFGYGTTPDPKMVVKRQKGDEIVEELVPFEIKNVAKPTIDEITAFSNLTPAQKVAFIQENFRDAGIFKSLLVNLYNVRDINGKKAGSQTIEFVEDSVGKEDAYVQMVEAFTNRNPLIALAAYDLIKYAFIVEGYKISKRGISKIIPNSLLYNDFGVSGTGLVNELNGEFVKMQQDIEYASAEDRETTYINYVRGHATALRIPLKRVTRRAKTGFELKKSDKGLIIIAANEENVDLALKYNILFKGANNAIHPNSFIRLSFSEGDDTLYRIKSTQYGYVLYPLNRLEENEHELFSANSAHWQYSNHKYYENLCKQIDNLTDESAFGVEGIRLIISNNPDNAYRKTRNRTAVTRFASIDFDMTNPSRNDVGMVDHINKEVQNFYKHEDNNGKTLYMRDRNLEYHIKAEGTGAGLIQYLNVTHGEGENQSVEIIKSLIYRVPYKEVMRRIQPYLGKGDNLAIKEQDKRYSYIIQRLRSEMVKDASVVPIFAIQPVKQDSSALRSSRFTEGRNATSLDVAGDIFKSVSRVVASDNADEHTTRIRQYWKDNSINADPKNLEKNLFNVLRSGSEYITKRVKAISDQLKYFLTDEATGLSMAVNNPEVMKRIYKDPELRNKFLKTIQEAEAIVRNNMSILELDIQAQDDAIQPYLNKIKEQLQKLQNSNLINEAQTLFANEYLKEYSTNPLIQRDILNVLNGFYSTSWLNSWVGDLQETSNPMLQIISKKVTSDLFAKEKLAHIRVREFEARLADIVSRAKAKGMSVDWKNIVDEDGRIIQNFTPQLLEDMDALRDKVTAALEAYNNGTGDYKAYLEAKLDYDKWKVQNINQELPDAYYLQKLYWEERMLRGISPSTTVVSDPGEPATIPNFSEVYVRYKELEAKRRDIYSHTVNGFLDPSYLDELDKIKKEIRNLIDISYVNPLTGRVELVREEYDPYYNPLTGTEEEKKIKRMYSGASQRAIRRYLEEMLSLNKAFFKKDPAFGFDEELEKNVRIITSYEKRDANGNITVPMNLLMQHPEYVAAKEWLAHSARFILAEESLEKRNEAFKKLHKDTSRIQLKSIVEAHKAMDVYGVIDATEFTEEEIERIKREQTNDQNYNDSSAHSDRTLIRNCSNSTVIYKSTFYHGLTTGGTFNIDWYKKVNEINSILEQYWDPSTKTINFDLIPNTPEGRAIYSKLETLYDELRELRKKTGATKAEVKKVIKFREENVDEELTAEEQAEFDKQEAIARGKGTLYYQAWCRANYEATETGRRPNRFLYGSLHPKAAVADKWIDKEKTEAVNTLNQLYTSTPTEYYYRKATEMSKQGKEAFNKWYYANHVWNPSTRTYDPIRCWTTYTYKDTSPEVKGSYVPLWNNTKSSPISRNPYWIPDVGHAMNYKVGTNYDNPKVSEQNEFEQELKTYVQDLLYSLVHTDSGLRYLKRGYLPSLHKAAEQDAKSVGKEFLKALGWTTYHNGKETFHKDVGYDTDRTQPMPMLSLLDQRQLEDGIKKPVQEENESDEDFAKRVAEYEEKVKTLKEENAKAHREALNQNWEEVLKSFILQASHFNAIQDNKYMLFYGRRMLDKLETYTTKYGGLSSLEKDFRNSTEDSPEYRSKKEKHLIEQYENWVRRLVYDEWKEPRDKLTKWASRLQSLTSAQYMMMNIRGGIANVTLGNTQILAEAFAKEYFGTKAWNKGIGLWNSGIISYFARMESDTSISLPDAIIKWMNVVDYDENTGKSRIVENPTMKGFNRFNKVMYSPQTIGENYMQNSVLFAMLYEHRIYEELDPVTGKTTIKFKNLEEARRDADIQALKSVLTDEQQAQFDQIIKEVKEDANKLKDYAWYQKDFVYEFAQTLNRETQKKYVEAKKKLEKLAKDEHEKHNSVMDELTLGSDGYMGFKQGGILEKYNVADTANNNPISDTMAALADFRGRVISVNKKIHGVYDKLGQAQLEKKWYGSLVMQYHKHIYPGMLKRWRIKGMYNEQRGTIEKGSYISLIQFLGTPIRKAKAAKELSEGEVTALESLQNLFKQIIDFIRHYGFYRNMLPDYEKANLNRNWGDIVGVVSAILLAMALRGIDDDDKDESIWYNLALYEADRLASESFQFNPFGMASEAKKLWSTPIAAQSGLEDVISTLGFISDWLFDEDFDPVYQSGRFAGQNKFLVRLKRRIPIYRGINTGLFEITESNHYYKMGQNMLNSQIVENMLEWVDSGVD